MCKSSVFRLFLWMVLAFALSMVMKPVSAVCVRNFTINSNLGSNGDDLITCGPGHEPTSDVAGWQGNDVIVVQGIVTTNAFTGGGTTGFQGSDHITIAADATVGNISGDYDQDGGLGGNDTIVVNGISRRVYGDDMASTAGADGGGADTIIIGGQVGASNSFQNVAGDVAQESGGADDIHVLKTGRVYGDIHGDNLVGPNAVGGDDTITIVGTVIGGVYADYVFGENGISGNDTIVVDKGGFVVQTVRGDTTTGSGGSDKIIIMGTVNGTVMGDDVSGGNAGNDEIQVLKGGDVNSFIAGDYQRSNAFANGNDVITIAGQVDDVHGDGYNGHGGNDEIDVQYGGEIVNIIAGDWIAKNRNGGNDRIYVGGIVQKSVYGDGITGTGGTSVGGADIIVVEVGALVKVAVHGDQQDRRGGNGGQDTIYVFGTVGANETGDGVFGDKAGGNGGNDFIHVQRLGNVQGSVIGDDVNGLGGQDLIWIDGVVSKKVIGDSANSGNAKDQIAVRQGGLVGKSIVGDGTNNAKNGGWDTINILGGRVVEDIVGDDVGGNGGNDFIAIRMGGEVGRNVIGDDANGNGGNDTLTLINGLVMGDMIGDSVNGDGGNDTINVLVSGTVSSDVIGDKVGTDKLGGDDSIFVSGKVNGRIIGDHPAQNAFAGADNIQTSPSAVIGQGIIGDNAKGAGKNDNFKINGKVSAGGVRGDVVLGKGGNDVISIFSQADVVGNVIGDDANGAGGNDTILVDGGGKVTGNVWGDHVNGNGGNDQITIEGAVTGNVEGDHHKAGSTANGGDDTIIVETSGLVQGNVFGDNSPGNGGDDKIDIKGKVDGNVLGDQVGGAGGSDIIRIFPTGIVGGSVCGGNFCNNNPGDNVVFLDEDAIPTFDSADTIIIAGKVLGNVIAGTSYGHSDDTVIVTEGSEIGGTVYAGDETEGDSFIYVENIINEEKTISDVVNGVSEKNGKVTVNGVTYTLDDVEVVSGVVGQIACFGMDYRMNKSSDGCAARSQSEKDAIQWHRDNPGNDGRLPGLEGCAVYAFGNGMRIYEIVNGVEGELVAEVWGDVLSDAPASNELLGATPDGNIALYYLASGELQIECRNLVDGKTQVRVLSDLAGTVVNAYDKG